MHKIKSWPNIIIQLYAKVNSRKKTKRELFFKGKHLYFLSFEIEKIVSL